MELTTQNKEDIRTLMERWGDDLQVLITMEQCGQLSTECSHWLRWRNNPEKIINRVADMHIMLETMEQVFHIDRNILRGCVDEKLQKALEMK